MSTEGPGPAVGRLSWIDLKSFHFSVGDSTTGAIGLCARVKAETPEKAEERLREALENAECEIRLNVSHASRPNDASIEYITAYVNTDFITAEDIDDEEDAD